MSCPTWPPPGLLGTACRRAVVCVLWPMFTGCKYHFYTPHQRPTWFVRCTLFLLRVISWSFNLQNWLLETNRHTHTHTHTHTHKEEKDLEGTLSWLALNLEVLVTVACFRWEAAVITFMSKTPLFGLEKLKVYLIKVLLAKGLGPPSFALLSSIKTMCFRSSRVPGLEMNPDLEWGVCGEKGLMSPQPNSDRIIQTLKKWSILFSWKAGA